MLVDQIKSLVDAVTALTEEVRRQIQVLRGSGTNYEIVDQTVTQVVPAPASSPTSVSSRLSYFAAWRAGVVVMEFKLTLGSTVVPFQGVHEFEFDLSSVPEAQRIRLPIEGKRFSTIASRLITDPSATNDINQIQIFERNGKLAIALYNQSIEANRTIHGSITYMAR
jgi:hypothetical protein